MVDKKKKRLSNLDCRDTQEIIIVCAMLFNLGKLAREEDEEDNDSDNDTENESDDNADDEDAVRHKRQQGHDKLLRAMLNCCDENVYILFENIDFNNLCTMFYSDLRCIIKIKPSCMHGELYVGYYEVVHGEGDRRWVSLL